MAVTKPLFIDRATAETTSSILPRSPLRSSINEGWGSQRALRHTNMLFFYGSIELNNYYYKGKYRLPILLKYWVLPTKVISTFILNA
jgi:hypothetical protein